MNRQQENSTFKQKVILRKEALKHLDGPPVIMETHGGKGVLYRACYDGITRGVVFEKDPGKSSVLALQRPTWRVYEADCEKAIADGVASDMPINLLDVDPYGDPWPVIGAFLAGDRARAKTLVMAVNDGLRKSAQHSKAWTCGSLEPAVRKYGNALHGVYLEVCQEMLKEKASGAGYTLTRFAGYYCGHSQQMTHYLGVLTQ